MRVAVVAHKGKTLGGGLDELRTLLGHEEITDLCWYEVKKSRKAPRRVRKALKKAPDLLLVWGGLLGAAGVVRSSIWVCTLPSWSVIWSWRRALTFATVNTKASPCTSWPGAMVPHEDVLSSTVAIPSKFLSLPVTPRAPPVPRFRSFT